MVKRISALTLALITVAGCQQTVPSDSAGGQNSVPHKKVLDPVAGIDIENSVPFKTLPPHHPSAIASRYMMGDLWSAHDFNNDGLVDYLFTGTMQPDNPNYENSVDTGDACGRNTHCTGDMPGPSLFLADGKGNFVLTDGMFIDNRSVPGQSLARQNLVGDFNGDGVKDLFVADTAIGTHKGIRDSYFLSQPNGKWIESSKTHLSQSNYRIFDHGGAVGDIDADGDLDLVLVSLANNLVCWLNNGAGYLTKRSCGKAPAYAIELADMDNDGDLDIVHGGKEGIRQGKAAIVYNNGDGRFSGSTQLPTVSGNWKGVPEVSVSDLDNDGDYDIVVSRVGELYVGTGVQVIENNNGKFNSQFITIEKQPKGYKPTTEGNKYNNFIKNVVFDDVNNDGTTDIVFTGENTPTHGGVLLNNGNFDFSYAKPGSTTNPIELISDLRFVGTGSQWIADLSIEFDDSIGQATLLAVPIELGSINGVIEGVSRVLKYENGTSFVAHIKTLHGYMQVQMCTEYYQENDFLAARVGFDTGAAFAGIYDFRAFGSNGCNGKGGYAGHWETDKSVIPAVLQDLLLEINEKSARLQTIK